MGRRWPADNSGPRRLICSPAPRFTQSPSGRLLTSALLCFVFLLPSLASAHFLPWRTENDDAKRRAMERGIPLPDQMDAIDQPNDDGSTILLSFTFEQPEETTGVQGQVSVDGQWYDAGDVALLNTLPRHRDLERYYGAYDVDEKHKDYYSLAITGYEKPGADGSVETVPLETGRSYDTRLMVWKNAADPAAGRVAFAIGAATPTEQWYNTASLNQILVAFLFTVIMLTAIFMARKNPNLFIRRIAGLEAVDEAIGRATEMGRPVLQVNGLDPLTQPATVAAVNILGRIARRVATYDSHLMVPCVDPVVMTVSQETVKQAYAEAGRPDAYRQDSVFFVTDQQFSYVASVCGMMVRERPAAIVYLGAFYAESLLLAETGAGTGAIQIAGTDAQHQLPFFVTTCDFTLIGEELYAASAYLSREPLLLGSLKGLDVTKAILMLMILLGTLLATLDLGNPGHGFDFLTRWFTPLQ